MGDQNDMTLPRFGGRPERGPSDACAEDGVLAAIVHAACDPDQTDSIGAALEGLVTSLGLSRASLTLVRDDGELRRLEPVAAAGEHASFARDMPAVPLEQMADAAIAVTERRALYVHDVHGLGEKAGEQETGVARWRQGMSVQAHALLPVTVHDHVLGVLTVEWSTPQEFSAGERESLEAVALLFGLVLGATQQTEEDDVSGRLEQGAAVAEPAEPAATEPTQQIRRPADLSEESAWRMFGYGVTDHGAVVPDSAEAPQNEGLALHVTVAVGDSDETKCPFWDVIGVAPHTFALIGGTVQAPRGGARELADECAALLRASCSGGRRPADALNALSASLASSGPGSAWVSAGCWRIDLDQRSFTFSTAGAVVGAHASPDGRVSVSMSDAPALGANAGRIPTDEFALVLPGDTLALCAGSVAWARAEAGQEAISVALAREDAASGHRGAAEQLVELAADASTAPFIGIVDVLGR